MGDLFHRWQRQTGAIVVTVLMLFATAFTFTNLGSKSDSYKHGTFDETAIIDSSETRPKYQNASASVLSKNELGELANRVLRVGAEASEMEAALSASRLTLLQLSRSGGRTTKIYGNASLMDPVLFVEFKRLPNGTKVVDSWHPEGNAAVKIE
jgi:hypothetical protein